MHQRIPLVKAVMTPFPYSVGADASVEEAGALMEEHRIRHLPVVDGEALVGIVSDRDIRLVAEPGSRRVSVGSICEKDVYVVELTERLDGVLDEMLDRRVGSAIVVKANRVVGIFTAVDACRFLRRLLENFFPTDDSHVAWLLRVMSSRSIAKPISPTNPRSRFINRTYAHLLGAVLAFVAFEFALFSSGAAERLALAMGHVPWALILGAFLLIAWMASRLAWRIRSRPIQYLGLGIYIVAKGLIFVPLLYRAEAMAGGLINQAAQVTLLGVLGLTIVAMSVKSDFSSLRPFLYWGGAVALILIVAAIIFGLHLGTWFSVGMIALSGGSILYDTAQVARRFQGGQYVGAALSLFASIGMMFWYVLRLTTRVTRG